MTTRPSTARSDELPFILETQLEWEIAADPAWLQGITWGTPRSGHPEGLVMFHIRDVLNNIDHFFGGSSDRPALRLIALTHDTFKYQVVRSELGSVQSHGYLARKFAEQYVSDFRILEVIELHDQAYKAYLFITQHGDHEAAEWHAKNLITRLGKNIDLFMHFYLCDVQTGNKSSIHYEWFKRVAGWL